MRTRLLLAMALILAGVMLWLRVDDVAGLYVDDAWYILIAKAIASGHGFTLSNVPVPGVLSFYPPGFPLLLSLVFRLVPEFPQNVIWLKLPSVVALLATSVVSYLYFRRARDLGESRALMLSLVVVFFPGAVFLATSTVMAEPVFAFVQLAAIALVERATRREAGPRALVAAGAAGILIGLAILVRSIAAPLLPAAALYLAWRRGWREAVVASAVALAVALPWFVYAHGHAPTPQQEALVNDQITVPYTAQFWLRVAGYQEHGWASASELPRRVLFNLRTAATSSVGALHAYPLFRLIEPAEWRWSRGAGVVSSALTLLTLAGLVRVVRRRVTLAEIQVLLQMAIIIAFPYPSYRYMLPLLPFFVFYASEGIEALVGLATRRARLAEQAATAFLAVCLVSHVAVDLAPLVGGAGERTVWQQAFDENRALLGWVRENVPGDAVLATHNPAMVHLYTGRKTVGYWMPSTDLGRWRAAGVAYWVDCWYAKEKFPDLSRSGWAVRYRSPTLQNVVVDLRARSR